MEVNTDNKSIYDYWYNDYVKSYINDYSKDVLEKCAKIFSYGQLIRECIKNKNYSIAYGCMAPDDIKQYDVIIPIDNHTSYFDYPGVVISNDIDNVTIVKPVYGGGNIDNDKLVYQTFYID